MEVKETLEGRERERTGKTGRARQGCGWLASRREQGRGTSTGNTSRPPIGLLSLSPSFPFSISPFASAAAPPLQ